jgi:hypothetical protein
MITVIVTKNREIISVYLIPLKNGDILAKFKVIHKNIQNELRL